MNMFTNHQKKHNHIIFSIVIVLLLCSLVTPSVNAQLFSESSSIQFSTHESTPVFVLGNLSLSGSFQGIEFDEISSLIQESTLTLEETLGTLDIPDFTVLTTVYGFPLFSETIIDDATVYLVNTTYLSSITDYSSVELLSLQNEIISSFSNVSITVNKGIAFFGSNTSTYDVEFEESYGLGGIFQLPFSDQFFSQGLGIVSDQQSLFSVPSDTSLLYPYQSEIMIRDGNKILTTVSQSDQLLLLKTTDDTTIQQKSTVHFFPLPTSEPTSSKATLTISDGDPSSETLNILFKNLSETISQIDDTEDQSVLPIPDQFELFTPYLSQIFDGGLIILNASEELLVEETSILNPTLILARGPEFSLTLDQKESLPISLNGESTLLFVNDHFYSSNAQQSETGIALPLLSIILWIAAVVSIIFYWSAKTQKKLVSQPDEKPAILQNRWIRILLYGVVLVILFLLIDQQFSSQFGLSLLTLPATQNDTIIPLVFFLIQCVILLFFFLMYAFPSILIHNVLCKTTIRNSYQFLTKILVFLPVFWIGMQLYFLILFNIFLSFISIPSINGLG